MTFEYVRYPTLGGGGGVTSLNGETGDITLVPGTGISITPSGSTIVIANTEAGGTVTSVALADGSTVPLYAISGSPVTSSGTLVFTLNSQSANTVLAGPTTGSSSQPSFRGLVVADIPALPYQPSFSGFTTDGVIYAASSSTVASTGVPTNSLPLVGNGAGAPPTFQALNLTAGVTGTLDNTHGGTGQNSSFTQYGVVYAATNIALATTAAGSAGQVFTSNGTSAPTFQPLPSSGANTTLSNLTSPTAINQHLLPGSSLTFNIGSTTEIWNNTYSNQFTVADIGSIVFTDSFNNPYGMLTTLDSVAIPDGTSNIGITIRNEETGATTTNNSIAIATSNNGLGGANQTGSIYIQTGNKTSGGNTGQTGSINLRVGTSSNTGTRGLIQFQNGTEGTAGQIWTSTDTVGSGSWAPAPSSGISSISVASANGLAGSSSGGSTPVLTLSTSITGLLKGNGTSISAASAGTDYVIPSGSITGTASNITASSNSTLTTLSSLSLPTSQLSGDIALTTQVSGILPVANGGTSLSTLAANNVILGNGTSTPTFIAPGTSGNVLTSNGTTWISSSPTAGVPVVLTAGLATGITPAANTNFIYDTIITDTNSGYNTSTGNYTVPFTGQYLVSVTVEATSGALSGPSIYVAVNGSNVVYLVTMALNGTFYSGSAIVSATTGQTISIQTSLGTVSYSGSVSAPWFNYLSISQVQ